MVSAGIDIIAKGRHIRCAPRKARLVVDLVRGLPVEQALATLKYTNKRVAKDIEKIVKSAVANAEENFELRNVEDLYVREVFVDAGPTWKRIRPRSMGMASRIRKRTCHITVILDLDEEADI